MKPHKPVPKLEADLVFKAGKGDVSAQLELASFYEKLKLWNKAEEWYLRASEDYNDQALVQLGSLYLKILNLP